MSSRKGAIRLLEKQDFSELALYLEKKTNNIQSRSLWLDYFHSWWETNPAMDADTPRGWVLLNQAGAIVGCLGNIPVHYLLHGEVVTVCSGTCWFVDDEFSDKSLNLLSRFLRQKHPLLNTTPIDRVYAIFTSLGFKDLSGQWLRKDGIYPVNQWTFWDFLVRKKFSDKPFYPLLKAVRPVAGSFIRFFQNIRLLGRHACFGNFSAHEITGFTDSHAPVLEEFSRKYSLLVQRTPETLNWFFFNPGKIIPGCRVIEIREKDTPVGYAAVKLKVRPENNRLFDYYEVVDLVLVTECREAFFTLFNGLVELGNTSGKSIAFIKLNPFLAGIDVHMNRFGFLWQQGKAKYIYKGLDRDTVTSGFYATPLDGDRCFFSE